MTQSDPPPDTLRSNRSPIEVELRHQLKRADELAVAVESLLQESETMARRHNEPQSSFITQLRAPLDAYAKARIEFEAKGVRP